jgi:hypothetical protein
MDDATRFEQIVQRMQKQNTSAAGDAPIYRIVLTGGSGSEIAFDLAMKLF